MSPVGLWYHETMETIIATFSTADEVSYTYLLAAIAGFIGVLLAIFRAMSWLEDSLDQYTVIVFCAVVLVAGVFPAHALGTVLDAQDEAEASHIASIMENVESDHSVVDLHPVGEPISHCTAESPYDTTMYTWKQVGAEDKLVRGTLEKSAEKDGSCSYRLYEDEARTSP